ncbi:MAG TPA: hypothetical protein PLG87_05175 [Treponemataceae bacterium]|jgi:hypothetical protein|nr:hypothetical protein [Treponemataceae bacterium]
MNITGFNKARGFLLILFTGFFLILHSVELIKLSSEYNCFLLGGIILFFISMAVILEKIAVDTILRNVEVKNKIIEDFMKNGLKEECE